MNFDDKKMPPHLERGFELVDGADTVDNPVEFGRGLGLLSNPTYKRVSSCVE